MRGRVEAESKETGHYPTRSTLDVGGEFGSAGEYWDDEVFCRR